MKDRKCSKCNSLGWFLIYYGSNPESDPQRILCRHEDGFNQSVVETTESAVMIPLEDESLNPIVQLS